MDSGDENDSLEKIPNNEVICGENKTDSIKIENTKNSIQGITTRQ